MGIRIVIPRFSCRKYTNWYRVRIGPIADLNELNILQNRLAQAQIDILRIRISD